MAAANMRFGHLERTPESCQLSRWAKKHIAGRWTKSMVSISSDESEMAWGKETSMQRTVIVTGGAGYIGSHICKALHRSGIQPVTIDDLSSGNEWAVKWGPLHVANICDSTELRR